MSARDTSGRIECVYLTCFRPEFSFLSMVLRYSGIYLHQADGVDEADFLLTVTGSTVFLSDVAFPDGTWRDALEMAAKRHPLAPAMIVADRVDQPFLADAMERGACAILWKPWDYIRAIERIQAANQASKDRAMRYFAAAGSG
jgi:DNA-binding NtrC family response regulator